MASHEEPPTDARDGISVQRQARLVDLQRDVKRHDRRGRELDGLGEEEAGGMRERVAGDHRESSEQVEE